MRIALTGSHGYVGSNLLPVLRQKHEVDCFDLKIGRSYLDLIYEPIEKYDTILHLAAFSNVGKSHKTHTLLSANVIDLATLMTGLRGYRGRFVFTSSSAVYAMPESGPYGLSKALGETIALAVLPDATIVRPFNVIGGAIPDTVSNDHLIPKLFTASRHRTPFTLYGGGEERRYYVHVDVLVQAFVDIVEGRLTQREVEVRSDRAYSVQEVVSMFQTSWPLEVELGASRRDNPYEIESRGLVARRVTCSAVKSIQSAFSDYERQEGR